MQIRVGLFGPNLHKTTPADFVVLAGQELDYCRDGKTWQPAHVKQASINIRPSGITLSCGSKQLSIDKGSLKLKSAGGIIAVAEGHAGKRGPWRKYKGELVFAAADTAAATFTLITDLESYVRGVLGSEIPASYHIEAMKAQAVLARTYGLHPRLDHSANQVNVCDSFLCCQAFNGITAITARQAQAIQATRGQLLLFGDKPALALFSACAGGHTEDYQNCFSDPISGAFPPAPISYLKGVAEGPLPPGYPDDSALRKLFSSPRPKTADAWSPSFSWSLVLSAAHLEGHMHHVIATMAQDPLFKDFITAPDSGQFGHIDSFEAGKRGCAGTIIEFFIHTSTGTWTLRKELVIRSAFANGDLGLKRLRSARFFIDSKRDRLGLLESVRLSGFGSGHGVGLQQVGAQGWALSGRNYHEILAHYYPGTTTK